MSDRQPEADDPFAWTAEQRQEAADLVASRTWGDVDGNIRTLEEALGLAMEATKRDFQCWERYGFEEGFDDEFSLSAEQVASLSQEWRLAYVARLLRSIALVYGAPTEFRQDGRMTAASVEGDSGSLATLLHGLNDISVGIQR